MLFFNRNPAAKAHPKELRSAHRYAVGPTFPLQAVLNLVGRDEDGELLKTPDGRGWDWKGRLINLSYAGVSLQLPLAVYAVRGDPCLLVLSLDGLQFTIPGHVANLRRLSDSAVFGLKLDFVDGERAEAYRQLTELVALGASLKAEKNNTNLPDASGYVVEQFRGDFGSHLTVWRRAVGQAIEWFEFQLTECCVRGDVGTGALEFTSGIPGETPKPATATEGQEIRRLFRWIAPNLARAVPADIRQPLQQVAAEIRIRPERAFVDAAG